MRLKEICPAVRADVLKRLRAEWSLARKVQRMQSPVAGKFVVNGSSVTFYPEYKVNSRKLAFIVGKLFGVDGWKRVFSEWDGSWSYKTTTQPRGKFNHEVYLTVSDAPQPKGCRVVEHTVLRTEYKSICNEEDTEVINE